MKWVAGLLISILTSACTIGPTIRQIQPKQYEITVQFDRYACKNIIEHSRELCKKETGNASFNLVQFDQNKNAFNPKITSVIHCRPNGFWAKPDNDASQRKRDFYECSVESEVVSQFNNAQGFCEILFSSQKKQDIFFKCLAARGYEFVETPEKEDLKLERSVPQSSLGVNWEFLVESKTGDSKLYLDWDSVKWGYSGDEVTFRLKEEYTNGKYTILTLKYYCIKKKFAAMHGAAYNREGKLIEHRSKWDDIPKDIKSDVMSDLHEILCESLLNKKKEK